MLAHRASERASGVAGMREWGYRGLVKVVGPALAMESGGRAGGLGGGAGERGCTRQLRGCRMLPACVSGDRGGQAGSGGGEAWSV